MDKEQFVSPFKKSGQFLARRSAQQLGKLAPRSSETAEQPVIVGGKIGVATGLLETQSPEVLRERAKLMVQLLVHDRVINHATKLVEVRPLLPKDEFRGADRQIDRGEDYTAASQAMISALGDRYGIEAIDYPQPITPTLHEDSAVDPETVSLMMGAEFDNFQYHDYPRRHLAMLAIAEQPYARRVFSEPLEGFRVSDLNESPLVVVQPANPDAREGLSMAAQTFGLLEEEASPPAPIHRV